MKIKKKVIIPVVAVAVIAAAVAVPRIVGGAGSKTVEVSVTPLSRIDLENLVSVTGTVKSEDVTNVYSTLSYQVKTVNVKVGDSVAEGDVLCVLDTDSLSAKIDQQSAAFSNNQAKAQHNLAVAQNNLETEKYNQENNYDTQLLNAQKSVEQSEQMLESKKSALETARISLTGAEQAQKSNGKALSDYRNNYGTPKYGEYEAEYDRLYQAFVQGELNVTKAENAVLDAEKAVEDAKKDVEDAKTAFEAVKVQKEEALTTSRQQVKSAQLNANLSDSEMQIDELKKDLDKATVTAPVSGTVTAVMATEGGNGQGLLFVIEDTEKLLVATKIKEYDVASVKVGQTVRVKSDGTGDDEYEGRVSKIAPTALKAANGDTVETTDVQFAAEVGILRAGELKIGMNARIDIVTEQKPQAFAVPFDAVVEDDNGESIVFVARPQAEEADRNSGMPLASPDTSGSGGEGFRIRMGSNKASNLTAVAIPVKTGMETDIYIEIMSDSLKEGDLVISNPASIYDGQVITLGTGTPGVRAAGARGGPGMAMRMG